MSMAGSRGQLKGALSQLMVRWDQITEKWDDPASRAFEEEFLLPMEPAAKAAFTALDQMADIMAKARRECQSDAY